MKKKKNQTLLIKKSTTYAHCIANNIRDKDSIYREKLELHASFPLILFIYILCCHGLSFY